MLSPTYCGFFWPKLSAIWGAFLYMGKYKHKKRAVFVGCHFDVHFTASTISIMMKIFDYQKMVIYGCQENWGWSLIIFSPLRQKLSKAFPNEAIKSPSFSVKIQIFGGEVYLRHCWVMSTSFLFLKFIDNAHQCFAFTPQANFPAHNLNFHWRWWDQIQATF